jgi:hypothetical protein
MERGDRLWLFGGWDRNPAWRNGADNLMATVEDILIAGDGGQARLLARLSQPLTLNGVTGELLLLSLRYRGASWSDAGICHIVLCSERPGSGKWWEDKSRFTWVESHAGFQKLGTKSSSG